MTEETAKSLPRESLRRKRSARIAAVQALYSYAMSANRPTADGLIAQLQTQWQESIAARDAEWPGEDLPEQSMLRDVISGVLGHLQAIDEQLQAVIREDWRDARMDPVMIALFRCATYELAYRTDRKLPMLIDEYVTIASGFFEENNLSYIHSALQRLGQQLRQGDA